MPLTLIVSAVILVLIVIALVVFLANQPDGSETAEGPAIDAMKVAPDPVTPVTQPRPGLQVYTEGQPMTETPAFAPPPETPALRPTTPAPTPTTVATPTPKPAPKADPVGALTVAAAPKAAPTPKTTPTPAVMPAPKAPAVSGGVQVQIGAFSSVAQAERGWNDVAALMPGQMAGKTRRVESVDRNGQTLQRAFVGGFSSKADADAFCAALKEQNRSCLVR